MTPRLTAMLAVLIFVGFAYWSGDANGSARERGRALQSKVDTLTIEVRRVDTLYKANVRTLTKVLTHYDSARVTDTLTVLRNDTVRVYVSRETADSAVSMCRLTLGSCARSLAARDSLISGLRLQVRTLESSKPGFVRRWGERALIGWVAYKVGQGSR